MRTYVPSGVVMESMGLSRNKLNQIIHNKYLLKAGIVLRLPQENGRPSHARIDYEGLAEYMRLGGLD